MRLHLIALPHTATTSRYSTCAYTQKIIRFCRMMSRRGWDIVLYGSEQNEAPCAEHVVLISETERQAWFGDKIDTTDMEQLSWDPTKPYWVALCARAIEAMSTRVDKRDLILLSTGSQGLIAEAMKVQTKCEWTVGYRGILSGTHCAFESSSFMHEVYARAGIENGRDFDAVIPNFFDVDDFPLSEVYGEYLLYMGRVVDRKGIGSARDVAEATGRKLILAGPGVVKASPGRIETVDCTIEGDFLEYVGEVGMHERAELMGGAHALLAPTQYIEPFGGTAVEAMMCGTPAITTDWGAYRETVGPAFRYRTLAEAVAAVEEAGNVDRELLRDVTISRFSLEAVAPQFENWFSRLDSLWGKGWYEMSEPAVMIPA